MCFNKQELLTLREHLCLPGFLFFFYFWLIRSAHPFSFLSYGVFCVLLFFFVYVLYFVCQCLCSFTIALNVYTNLRFLN